MNGRGGVAVVTGATGSMGQAIALELVRRGMHVVTVVRDPRRAEALQERAGQSSERSAVEVVAGDLATRAGVKEAARMIAERHGAVHLLINNAGAHFAAHEVTVDGIERHIAVNHMAAYGLTVLLAPQLRLGDARVVNVVSDTVRDTRQIKLLGRPRPATLDTDSLDDLTRLNPLTGFAPFEAYARAKMLSVIAGYDLARTLDGDVTVNAVHPGIVDSDIIIDLVPTVLKPLTPLIRRSMLTPSQGAAAALRLATDPSLAGVSGRYFVRGTETRTPDITYRSDIQRRVRAASDRFLKDGSRSW